jgi:predicted transcriptional regulator
MPAPTTLKLPDELKHRIAPLAEAAGKSPHAWMVEAIERRTTLAETRADFMRAAEQSAREVDGGGALYAAEDVIDYLVARTAMGNALRPKPIGKPVRPAAKGSRAAPRRQRSA